VCVYACGKGHRNRKRDENVAIPWQKVFNIHVNKRTQIYLYICVYEFVRKGPQTRHEHSAIPWQKISWMYVYTHTYIFIYIYVCACVCREGHKKSDEHVVAIP